MGVVRTIMGTVVTNTMAFPATVLKGNIVCKLFAVHAHKLTLYKMHHKSVRIIFTANSPQRPQAMRPMSGREVVFVAMNSSEICTVATKTTSANKIRMIGPNTKPPSATALGYVKIVDARNMLSIITRPVVKLTPFCRVESGTSAAFPRAFGASASVSRVSTSGFSAIDLRASAISISSMAVEGLGERCL